MTKILLGGMVAGLMTMNLLAQDTQPKHEQRQFKAATEKKIRPGCTSVIEGRIFCIKTATVSVRSKQNIPIIITVQNKTAEIIYFEKYFEGEFDTQLFDSNQRRVLSRKEELVAKLVAKQTPGSREITPEIMALLLGPSRSARLSPIPAGGKISTTFNLADLYDLKKGKYKATIRKKNSTQNVKSERERLLGSIEIEIK